MAIIQQKMNKEAMFDYVLFLFNKYKNISVVCYKDLAQKIHDETFVSQVKFKDVMVNFIPYVNEYIVSKIDKSAFIIEPAKNENNEWIYVENDYIVVCIDNITNEEIETLYLETNTLYVLNNNINIEFGKYDTLPKNEKIFKRNFEVM